MANQSVVTFFPKTIEKVVLAMLDVHNEWLYEVKQKDKAATTAIVPIRFSQTEKLIAMIRSNDQIEERYRITLPLLGLDILSIDPDSTRRLNPICKIINSAGTQVIFNPVSYNFTFSLGIWAKYAADLFIIFEQIASKFKAPVMYPFLEFKFINGDSLRRDLPIELLSDTLNITPITDSASETIYQTELNFLVKGWFYDSSTISNPTLINSIDLNFENMQSVLYESFTIT